MIFYIATSLERGGEAAALAAEMKALGHELSYAWWEHGSVQADGPERIANVAAEEYGAIARSRIVVVLLPGGRGTHTELGIAIALADYQPLDGRGDRRLVIIGPTVDSSGRECSFYRHRNVSERFSSVAEALAFLRGASAGGGAW